jgi:hypothetical protein
MAEQKQAGSSGDPGASIPLGQRLFDRMFLLLVVSLLISGVLYNVWGLIETLGAPALTGR